MEKSFGEQYDQGHCRSANLSLACSLIAIQNTAPEQGKRNLDGDKSQLMLVVLQNMGILQLPS